MITKGKWCGHKNLPVACRCGSKDLDNACYGSAYQVVCNSCGHEGPCTDDDGEEAPTDSVILWNKENEK